MFAVDGPEAKARLAALNGQHDTLTEAWMDLPTKRAKEKAKTRLEEVEGEMAQWESKVARP
jgi:lipase chaperone LimK